MKFYVILLYFVWTSPAFAQEEEYYVIEPRRPSISYFAVGGENYSSSGLSGEISLSKEWRLSASLSGTRTYSLNSSQWTLGAEVDLTRTFFVNANVIARNEPGEIRGSGGNLGLNWIFATPGMTDVETALTIDIETIRYWQTAATRATLRLAREDILVQRALTLGIHQGLGKGWSVALFLTGYGYDQDPELWSEAVAYRYWTARAAEAPIPGFPLSNSNLNVTYFITEDWFVDLALISNRGYGGVKGDGVSLGTTYLLMPHWSFDVGVSSSRTEGVRNGGLANLGVRYFF